ncbi:hypothetical protein FRC08_002924, partial [Ceratobasidium sp. 394]
DVLAAFPSIPVGQHNITIISHANGSESAFSFDKANVILGSISKDPGQGDVYDSRNSSITYQGSWTQLTNNSTSSATAPTSYRETKVAGSTASLGFKGEAVVIIGALGLDHWLYQVTLDGVSRTYNASAWWAIGDTVLYFQAGLDPTKSHNITLTNKGSSNGRSTLNLNSITVFGSTPNPNLIVNIADHSDGDYSFSSVPTLTIAIAATVGALLSVILIFVLVFVYLRRNEEDRDGYDPITWGSKGSGGSKKVGYIAEPFTLPPNSPTLVKQPPIGYSMRSARGWSMEEPSDAQIGYYYWQDQKQPVSPTFIRKSDVSAHSAVSGATEFTQDESASATSDHGLLADRITARHHLPTGSGGQSLYEYVPLHPRDRYA